MKKFKSLLYNLTATDLLVIIFYLFLSLLNIIYADRIDNWLIHIIGNILLIVFVFSIAYIDKYKSNFYWEQLHFWYLIPLVFITYKELYFMIRPIRIVDFDQALINIDRWLFGFDVTVELAAISVPLLTEILQIVYSTFFFLPIILGIELMKKGRIKALKFSLFSVVYGFFLSYIGYILVPAIGPRFTLHDFELINTELPGLLLTNFLREAINAGEAIRESTLNPAEIVARDVFPSGHTQITLIIMYLSVKLKTVTRWFFIPNGILLIFATVYLRYHYLIDLIGGIILMIFTMWSGYYLYNYWMKIKNGIEFNYQDF